MSMNNYASFIKKRKSIITVGRLFVSFAFDIAVDLDEHVRPPDAQFVRPNKHRHTIIL